MNSTFLTTIAATGFTVAFFHAALPTHWLAFVLVARARGWSRARTLAVTLFAGLGHVAVTSLLGVAIAWFGFQLDERVGAAFPWVIGIFLFGVALHFFRRQWRGEGVCHHHLPGGHHQPGPACGHEAEGGGPDSHLDHELKDSALISPKTGEWTAVTGLFFMMTLSPCEGFLPVYLSGVRFGWHGFALLTGILAAGALAGMLLFTWLSLAGLERFKARRFERYEAALIGAMFVILGALVILLEH